MSYCHIIKFAMVRIHIGGQPCSDRTNTIVKQDESWQDKYIELIEQMNILVENLNLIDREEC
jgi:hypothetical protein